MRMKLSKSWLVATEGLKNRNYRVRPEKEIKQEPKRDRTGTQKRANKKESIKLKETKQESRDNRFCKNSSKNPTRDFPKSFLWISRNIATNIDACIIACTVHDVALFSVLGIVRSKLTRTIPYFSQFYISIRSNWLLCLRTSGFFF